MDFIADEKDYRLRCKAFQKCSYGDKNIDKKFRILCNRERRADIQGLLSTVTVILPNIIEARQHGYIPVIDLCKNSRAQPLLQERELAKKENAWEYYFTQPDKKISLEEVRQSMRVEVQMKANLNRIYYIGDACLQADERMRRLSKAVRENIHLQTNIHQRVVNERQRLFPKSDKVLGVGIRAGYRFGVLSNNSVFNGHPNVDSCEDYIRDIEKKLKEWKYDTFFLMIDDRQYLEEIKKYFGKSCIYLERARMHYFQDALRDIQQPPDANRMIEFEGISVRKRNEDYLVELYLLAQCDSLYASRGTGHNFSYLINNGKYSHVEFVDMGEFHYR